MSFFLLCSQSQNMSIRCLKLIVDGPLLATNSVGKGSHETPNAIMNLIG